MSSKVPDNLSDLFFAIGATIHGAGLGVAVSNYDDFDGVTSDGEVLIEIERTGWSDRQNDGRYVHDVTVTLHAVVGRHRRFASLEAANLATAIERLADRNRWGLAGSRCEHPRELHSGPSMFQRGADGYEAWATSFRQRLALGPGLAPEDPQTVASPLVTYAWQVASVDDPDNYQPLG